MNEWEKIPESIRAGSQTAEARTVCPRCNDTGYEMVGPDGKRVPFGTHVPGQKAARCGCTLAARIASRLPKLYQAAHLKDFHSAAIGRVGEFLRNPRSLGLLISGPAGAGKTHLAAAIARALIEANFNVLFLEVARVFSELRERMRSDESEEALLSRYVEVPFLVLDDLGAGSFSDFERRVLLDLLNRRGNERRKTIVTSNLELAELEEHLDERIASRLSAFDRMRATGKDRRAQRGSLT
jgi:DNA replication protein DnaC